MHPAASSGGELVVEAERALVALVCTLHRDGGHWIGQVGLVQATGEALLIAASAVQTSYVHDSVAGLAASLGVDLERLTAFAGEEIQRVAGTQTKPPKTSTHLAEEQR
jgi:hypothetical protein